MARIVHYDEIKRLRVGGNTLAGFNLTVRLPEGDEDVVIRGQRRDSLMTIYQEILTKFLEYKRGTTQASLQLLAQSHAALAGYAARFLDEVELIPGVPGGESEAAVERCKKRARGEGEE